MPVKPWRRSSVFIVKRQSSPVVLTFYSADTRRTAAVEKQRVRGERRQDGSETVTPLAADLYIHSHASLTVEREDKSDSA